MVTNFISSNKERTYLLEWAVEEFNSNNKVKCLKIFTAAENMLKNSLENAKNLYMEDSKT